MVVKSQDWNDTSQLTDI